MGIRHNGMLSEEYKTAPVKIVWVLKEALYDGCLSERAANVDANEIW